MKKAPSPNDFQEIIRSVATGSFFTGLSQVIRQDRHAKENVEIYIKCIELEQNIRTELITTKYKLQKANQPCDIATVLNKTIERFKYQMETTKRAAVPGINLEAIKTMRALVRDVKSKKAIKFTEK
jgi:hypothetical protein